MLPMEHTIPIKEDTMYNKDEDELEKLNELGLLLSLGAKIKENLGTEAEDYEYFAEFTLDVKRVLDEFDMSLYFETDKYSLYDLYTKSEYLEIAIRMVYANVHLSEIIDKQFKLDEKQIIEKDILKLMNKEVI